MHRLQAGRLYNVKFHTRDETSKDKKKHDAADKSTSKQQVCILDGSRLRCAKKWTHMPSASGSYDRHASYNLTSNAFFGYLNRFSDYFMSHQ